MQNPSFGSRGDAISILDLWKILVRRKWWVLAPTLLAVIAAAVSVNFIKPQWEATTAIRIGMAEQIIEPVPQVVERMKLKSFQDTVLARVGIEQQTLEAELLRNSLKVRALPNTDLVEIKVRGYSQESAKHLTKGVVDYMQHIHQEMAAPRMRRLEQLLTQVNEKIAQTQAEREKVLKIENLKDRAVSEARFIENVVLANVRAQRDNELRELEQAKMKYEELLDPVRNYPTSNIEKISMSEGSVAPKKALIVLLAGVLGLLVGVMAAFLASARQANKN